MSRAVTSEMFLQDTLSLGWSPMSCLSSVNTRNGLIKPQHKNNYWIFKKKVFCVSTVSFRISWISSYMDSVLYQFLCVYIISIELQVYSHKIIVVSYFSSRFLYRSKDCARFRVPSENGRSTSQTLLPRQSFKTDWHWSWLRKAYYFCSRQAEWTQQLLLEWYTSWWARVWAPSSPRRAEVPYFGWRTEAGWGWCIQSGCPTVWGETRDGKAT